MSLNREKRTRAESSGHDGDSDCPINSPSSMPLPVATGLRRVRPATDLQRADSGLGPLAVTSTTSPRGSAIAGPQRSMPGLGAVASTPANSPRGMGAGVPRLAPELSTLSKRLDAGLGGEIAPRSQRTGPAHHSSATMAHSATNSPRAPTSAGGMDAGPVGMHEGATGNQIPTVNELGELFQAATITQPARHPGRKRTVRRRCRAGRSEPPTSSFTDGAEDVTMRRPRGSIPPEDRGRRDCTDQPPRRPCRSRS
jgi:hypothetical protein